MTTTLPLPTSIDDVDATWLTAALRSTAAADGRVVGIERTRIAVELGFLGDLARVTPTWADGSGPASVIVKLPAATEARRAVATALGMYRREVRFYEQIAARVAGLEAATCYYSYLDEAMQSFVLLLSDLGPARAVDQIGGCSRVDAELAVDRLADLHAAFWEDDTLAGLDWLGAISDLPFAGAIGRAFAASWPVAQEMFSTVLSPELRAFGDRYCALLPEMTARLSAPPFTLCHGDFRLDNLFFAAGGRLGVCDWQLASTSRGARDVAYFLSQSVAPALRADIERAMVDRYVVRLRSLGVSDYDFDTAWEDYRLATCLSFAYPVVAGTTLVEGSERGWRLACAMFERSGRAVTDAGVATLFG